MGRPPERSVAEKESTFFLNLMKVIYWGFCLALTARVT